MSQKTNPLEGLERTIRQHWQTYRPALCAGLAAEGKLEESIRQAAANTRAAVDQLIDEGASFLQAWEAVREQWAILPAEDEDDDLGLDDIMAAMFGPSIEDEEADVWDEESDWPPEG
jgi:hypothetical protein